MRMFVAFYQSIGDLLKEAKVLEERKRCFFSPVFLKRLGLLNQDSSCAREFSPMVGFAASTESELPKLIIFDQLFRNS